MVICFEPQTWVSQGAKHVSVQVPEISEATKPKANPAALLDKVKRGQAAVGTAAAVPMLVGPVTIARLAQLDGVSIQQCVDMLLPAYMELLAELKNVGVSPSHSEVLPSACCMMGPPGPRPVPRDECC